MSCSIKIGWTCRWCNIPLLMWTNSVLPSCFEVWVGLSSRVWMQLRAWREVPATAPMRSVGQTLRDEHIVNPAKMWSTPNHVRIMRACMRLLLRESVLQTQKSGWWNGTFLVRQHTQKVWIKMSALTCSSVIRLRIFNDRSRKHCSESRRDCIVTGTTAKTQGVCAMLWAQQYIARVFLKEKESSQSPNKSR